MAETKVFGSMKLEIIPGDPRYVRLLEDFKGYSTTIKRDCTIPKGFVFDLESIPLLRGSNPEAGGWHDYYCRVDSDPIVDKDTAAAIYDEFQAYYDEKESGGFFNRLWDWICRFVKTEVVEVAPGYFHKFSVFSTYEEMKGD